MLAFHLTTFSNLGLLLFAWRYGKRNGNVWNAVCCGAALSLLTEFAYYCPLVHRTQYEWLALHVDLFSSAIDFYALCAFASSLQTCCAAALLAMVTIFWHQLVKLQWHWAAEIFRAPTGPDAFLNPLRVYSSWIVLCAYAWVAYCEGSAHRAEGSK